MTQPEPLTEDMVEKIIKRDEELRKDYYDMPSSFPDSSQPPNGKVTMVAFGYSKLWVGRCPSKASDSSFATTRHVRSRFVTRKVVKRECISW